MAESTSDGSGGPNRRGFLKKGLFGSALLLGAGAMGAVGLSLWPTRRVLVARRPLLVLDATEHTILAEIASTVVTAPGADPVEIAHVVDEALASQPAQAQRDVKRLLRVVESGLYGALLDARPRPFSQLSPAGKIAALVCMRDSRLVLRRGGYQALRRLTLSAHWSRPGCWSSIGYVGPPEIPGVPT